MMNVQFIINSVLKNGKNGHTERFIRRKFAAGRFEISYTEYPGHATSIARKAVHNNFDTIVAIGGDGTVNEVLNGMVGSDAALGIIPTGTANDLASYFCLPGKMEALCDVILRRYVHLTDLIRVNNRYYITAGGVGFPGTVAGIANAIKSRSKPGKLLAALLSHKLYILAVLWAILGSDYHNRIRVSRYGKMVYCDALSLMIQNQPFLGNNFLMAPGAVNDDGMFDVCLIANAHSRLYIFSILLKVLTGRHLHSPRVMMWRTDALSIEASHPLPFLHDGELLQKSRKFNVRVIPKSLKIIVPEKDPMVVNQSGKKYA
jgi:diacylglycerol kinase (ATP)